MGKLYHLPRSYCNVWYRLLPVGGIFILTLLLVLSITLTDSINAVTLRQGSNGEQVKALQAELQAQGFYSGNIDGIYGNNTIKAVRIMQQQYGLQVDGIAGPQTLRALGLDNKDTTAVAGITAAAATEDKANSLNADEITLLARLIHAEAESEPHIGKVAVGAVLLNRVKNVNFPNTLAGVIYQPLAFESVANGRIYRSCSEESLKAAREAAAGWDPTYGCLYFWNPDKATSAWIWTRQVAVKYGNHVFGI